MNTQRQAAEFPQSHLDRIVTMGLRVTCYLRTSVLVAGGRIEGLPQDLIGDGGKTLVVYRKADERYSIDGWEPWHDGSHGGREENIHGALSWVETMTRAKLLEGARSGA